MNGAATPPARAQNDPVLTATFLTAVGKTSAVTTKIMANEALMLNLPARTRASVALGAPSIQVYRDITRK